MRQQKKVPSQRKEKSARPRAALAGPIILEEACWAPTGLDPRGLWEVQGQVEFQKTLLSAVWRVDQRA